MKTVLVVFLGFFLFLTGTTALIELFFQVDLPLVRVFVASCAIYLGLLILTNSLRLHYGKGTAPRTQASTPPQNAFSKLTAAPHQERRFEIHFGKGEVDLSSFPELPPLLEIYSVCGHADVKLPRGEVFNFITKSIAGEIKLPSGQKVHLGSLQTEEPQASCTLLVTAILSNVAIGYKEAASEPKPVNPNSGEVGLAQT